MFVCCSGDLIVHLLWGWRGGIFGSEVISCSHPFQYFLCECSVLIRCRPEGIYYDDAFRMMVPKIFSPFWQFVGRCLLLSLSCISLRYRSQFAFFKVKLVRWGIGLIVKSICKLMRIGRWSEPRFIFICQLVEVIREADATETSVEDGLALPGRLVGVSQLRIPKLEPYIIFSNRVPLVSVELKYHADWCALKTSIIRVSNQGRKVTSCARLVNQGE